MPPSSDASGNQSDVSYSDCDRVQLSVLGLVHKVIDGVQFALWNLTDWA